MEKFLLLKVNKIINNIINQHKFDDETIRKLLQITNNDHFKIIKEIDYVHNFNKYLHRSNIDSKTCIYNGHISNNVFFQILKHCIEYYLISEFFMFRYFKHKYDYIISKIFEFTKNNNDSNIETNENNIKTNCKILNDLYLFGISQNNTNIPVLINIAEKLLNDIIDDFFKFMGYSNPNDIFNELCFEKTEQAQNNIDITYLSWHLPLIARNNMYDLKKYCYKSTSENFLNLMQNNNGSIIHKKFIDVYFSKCHIDTLDNVNALLHFETIDMPKTDFQALKCLFCFGVPSDNIALYVGCETKNEKHYDHCYCIDCFCGAFKEKIQDKNILTCGYCTHKINTFNICAIIEK